MEFDEKDKDLLDLNTEIVSFVLDFDELEEWRDPENEDLPVHGMISFYKACGLIDHLQENKDKFGDQIVAIDTISCNFYTQQRIKKFIAERWEVFSLSLLDNNKVIWNTSTYSKGVEHYHRKPSKKVTKSLTYDFLNYCPKLDDELEDNILELKLVAHPAEVVENEKKDVEAPKVEEEKEKE